MKRTTQQNKSLHLWCRQLAETLADSGYDMREVKVEIKPTEQNIKECFVKPVMKVLYPDITSTTELDSRQVIEVYDTLNKALGEKMGLHVPFPSEETLSESQR